MAKKTANKKAPKRSSKTGASSTAKKKTAKKTTKKKTSTKKASVKKKTAKKTKKSTKKRTGEKPVATEAATEEFLAEELENEELSVGDQEVTVDRRREDFDVDEERRAPERRTKVARRRQIDPTTCERDYSNDEIEFMHALDEYKRRAGRMFPTCSEILEVIRELGYRRLTPEESAILASANAPIADPVNDQPTDPEAVGSPFSDSPTIATVNQQSTMVYDQPSDVPPVFPASVSAPSAASMNGASYMADSLSEFDV